MKPDGVIERQQFAGVDAVPELRHRSLFAVPPRP